MRRLRLGCLSLGTSSTYFPRKRFAVGPHGTIRKMLLLPYGDRPFQRIDQPAAGIKRGSPVGGKDSNQHAALANFDPPQPVHDRSISDRETLTGFGRKPSQLLERHAFIGFIIQIKCPSAAAM